MASENKRLFNVSECVSDRSGVVVFVRKDGEYYCSDSFHEALKEIFNTRATVEYIDHDNNYKSVRVDASVDADKQNITLHIPAEFGSTEKALRMTYNIEGTFTAEEIACGSGGSNMVEKVLLDEPEAVLEVEGDLLGGGFPASSQIKPGQTYNVEIDGNKFSCIANSVTLEDGMVVPYIGNAALNPLLGVSEDTGEPFVAASVPGALMIIIAAPATYDAVDTRTFSIKITTLEEKSSGGGMMRINVRQVDDNVYTADKNYAEISEALQTGIVPYCVLGDNFFNLVVSDGFEGISTFAAMAAHKFTCLDFNGPWLYYLSIDANNSIYFDNVQLSTIEN